MSDLAALEEEILQRHQALQTKAKQTISDAAVVCHEGAGGVGGRPFDAAFIEESIKEVFAKADSEENQILEPAKEAPAVAECEVVDNVNATVRLQRVRLQDLGQELQTLRDAFREKEKENQELRKALTEGAASLEKEKENAKRHRSEIEKLKKECAQGRERLECNKSEMREIKDRLAEHEKEKRQLTAMSKNKEIRQKRVSEELERCRSAMESLRTHDRESREIAKADSEKLMAENKNLERQKTELVVALRKQIKLIDVLKRQKAHMEAAKLLSFTEAEFENVVCSTK